MRTGPNREVPSTAVQPPGPPTPQTTLPSANNLASFLGWARGPAVSRGLQGPPRASRGPPGPLSEKEEKGGYGLSRPGWEFRV